jgi:DNA helicase-2/ATP-dependent DNA helicase PcrA
LSRDLPLNPAQQAAVDHASGPVLVIAGAGSGKTRVLTARVARLIERGVAARAILAFTFTNRAAREMRERLERSLGRAGEGLWIGTFHATAVRLLRRESATLGLPPAFTIYDREDQEGVLKDVIRDLRLPETGYRTGMVLGRISDCKNSLVTPEQAERAAVSEVEKRIAECYRRYQSVLRRAGALDFDDLIAESVRLFLEHPEAGTRWSRRFEHVLVDEYQDTNHAQFRLVQALAAAHGNLFVVGDDDQSIYGWRGADLTNVLEFERAFPGAVTIRLEQNYRSTNTILRAANAVVANNQSRRGKTLWSEREDGEPIVFALCADEAEEAQRVRRFLEAQRGRGRALAQCAVLYRTNAQSRALETELRRSGIAYEIVGGVSFFQRREVKDVLAWLRLLVNPTDTASFWRIWNTPRRGLGATVEGLVQARLDAGAPDPLEALRELAREGALRGSAKAGAAALLALVDDLRAHGDEAPDLLIARVLDRSGYVAHLENTSEHDFEDRLENVRELAASAGAFAAAGGGGLVDFLSECSLLTDADRLGEATDRALLLTAHNAKGLEFDAVVIAGLEEGLMPHASSADDTAELEEERRLFYVALTRARDVVLLTAAAYRRRFDGAWGGQVSRFVEEIPPALIEHERPRDGGRAGAAGFRARRASRGLAAVDADGYAADEFRGISLDGDEGPSRTVLAGGRTAESRRAVGRRVHHETFGDGTVLEAEGAGADMKLTVRFRSSIKKVLARFVTGEQHVD